MKEIEPNRSAASWLAELAKGRYGERPYGAANTGVISLFQFPNKFIAACISCSLFHFGICSTFPSHAYIFPHRIIKQIIVL